MRDLLTALAIVLLLCLGGAVVAPHLVDWDARRDEVASHLSEAIGRKVWIQGPIAIEILPTPVLKLAHVRIGEGGAVSGAVGRFRMKLAVPPLLRGQIRVTEVTLQGADIIVRPAAVGAAGAASPAADMFAAAGFDRVLIRDSRLRVEGADGAALYSAAGIGGELEAGSLSGPFRGSLAFEQDGRRQALRLSSGRIEAGVMRLRAALDDEASGTRAEYDGVLRHADGAPFAEGVITASGAADLPTGDGSTSLAWRATARLKGSLSAVALNDIELTLGKGDRQLVLSGAGDVDLARLPMAKVVLATRQVDLDRMLAGEDGAPAPGPEALVAALARGGLSPLRHPELTADIEVTAGSLHLGGDVIAAPRLLLAMRGGVFGLVQAFAELPGRSRLSLNSAEEAGSREFAGNLFFESRDLARLSGWYHGVSSRSAIRMLSLQGQLTRTVDGLRVADATLVADDMKFSGLVEFSTAGARPRLLLRLASDRLDVAKLPDLPGAGQTDAWDFDALVSARGVRYRGVGAGDIDLRVTREAAVLRLNQLRVRNLDGADLDAEGLLNVAAPQLSVRLRATKLNALLQLSDRLSGHWGLPLLASRAGSLAPADLAIAWGPEPDGGRSHRATVKGRLGGTEVEASARLGEGGELTGAEALAIHLRSASPHVLARQIGLDSIAVASAGPVDLFVRGSGGDAPAAPWLATGTLGGVNISASLTRTSDPARPFEGGLRLSAVDIAPLAQTLLITTPAVQPGQDLSLETRFDFRGPQLTLRDVSFRSGGLRLSGEIAFNLAQSGRISGQLRANRIDGAAFAPLVFGEFPSDGGRTAWSAAPFSAPSTPALPGDLWIEAEAVEIAPGLTIEKPRFIVRFDDGLLIVERGEGLWLDGRVNANATFRRNGPSVSASARFGVDAARLDRLPASLARDALRGRGSLQVELSAVGNGPLALMSSLAGTGRLSLQDASVNGLSAGALDGVLKTNADFAAVTREALSTAIVRRMSGWLPLPSGEAPLAVAAGVARVGPLRVDDASEIFNASVAVDLRDMTLLSRTGVTARNAPKGWIGPPPTVDIVLRGPFAAPQRAIDVSSLSNGLTAIAIQREQERIEAIEQDQRERAYFNRRLRAAEEQRRAEAEERRRQEEERKRAEEEERRRLEAERRAQEEERRRIEVERRAQEDERRRQEVERRREEIARREGQRQQQQQELRQRIDDIIRNAPTGASATPSAEPLRISPPAVE